MVSKFFPNLKKSEAGITLVELIVVIFIITIFSLIAVSDFPNIQRRYALSRATYALAQDLRKVEDLGLSGVKTNDSNGSQISAKGYGVYINFSFPTKYLLYADVDTADGGNQKYDGNLSTLLCSVQSAPSSDCLLQAVTDVSKENASLYIKSVTVTADGTNYTPASNNISINFLPPNPNINIVDGAGSYKGAKIVLGLATDSSVTRTILINTSGLIDVQ